MADDTKPPRNDGVEVYPANRQDLESYTQASRQLGQMRVPTLVDQDNPHQRLFVAVLDGTGNNMFKDDDAHETGIVRIYKQIQAAHSEGKFPQIGAGYVAGIGTQDGSIASTRDGISGHTFEERAETMYKQFIEYAARELKRDPQAQISLAAVGFSRGAEEAAYLTRLVDERGIQDPTGAKYKLDGGLVSSVEYSRPPLVAPGKVAQAVLLQDPVATGDPLNYDRRLPPSVVSGLQVTAQDERRDQFLSTPHLRPGLTEGNRFLNVTVGGAHSNIGDSYTANGLGVRSTNLAVDYLNGLSDRPFLEKRALPDPSLNVVHRSEQHQWVYSTDTFDEKKSRGFNYDLAPPDRNWIGQRQGGAHLVKEPVDAGLSNQFPTRNVPLAPLPGRQQASLESPGDGIRSPIPDMRDGDHPDNRRYAQLHKAYGTEEAAGAMVVATVGWKDVAYAGVSRDGSSVYAMNGMDAGSDRRVIDLKSLEGRDMAQFNRELQTAQLNGTTQDPTRIAREQEQQTQGGRAFA